jgi:hypothetical protein
MKVLEYELTPYRVVIGRGAYTMGTADGVIIARLHQHPTSYAEIGVKSQFGKVPWLSFPCSLQKAKIWIDLGVVCALIIGRLSLAHGKAAEGQYPTRSTVFMVCKQMSQDVNKSHELHTKEHGRL